MVFGLKASRLSSENSVRQPSCAEVFDLVDDDPEINIQNASGTRLTSIQQNSRYVCFPAILHTLFSRQGAIGKRGATSQEAAAALFCCLAF